MPTHSFFKNRHLSLLSSTRLYRDHRDAVLPWTIFANRRQAERRGEMVMRRKRFKAQRL